MTRVRYSLSLPCNNAAHKGMKPSGLQKHHLAEHLLNSINYSKHVTSVLHFLMLLLVSSVFYTIYSHLPDLNPPLEGILRWDFEVWR